MTIYVVSGSRRTGTSMMMSALHSGRTDKSILDLLVAPEMERANPLFNGYQPNPNGLYEVGLVAYMEAEFLRWIPDDCLIKIMYDGLPNLYPGDYKIIWMDRDVDEILASEARLKRHADDIEKNKNEKAIDHESITKILPFCCLRPYNQENADHVLAICGQRADFDVMRVNYGDVLENPEREFKKLADWGVPIDAEKAASVVNPTLYRMKSEELECQPQSQECQADRLQLR